MPNGTGRSAWPLITAFVAVLALYGWLQVTGRNTADVIPWVAMLLGLVTNAVRIEHIQRKAADIQQHVNGAFNRANRTAESALAELAPPRAQEVLRRVDERIATDSDTPDTPPQPPAPPATR